MADNVTQGYALCWQLEMLFSFLGLRPEHKSSFRDDCWRLMSECWHEDASQRPMPGILHERLQEIIAQISGAKRV